MEGPSLHLAAEQLQPFAGRRIESVSGNSKIGIERLSGMKVLDIFAWGKHLVFQFETFALRVHFMLWGTFAATVQGKSVTGDYRRTGPPRLVLNIPRPKTAGHRRGRADVLVPLSGTAASLFVAQESRNLPTKRVP